MLAFLQRDAQKGISKYLESEFPALTFMDILIAKAVRLTVNSRYLRGFNRRSRRRRRFDPKAVRHWFYFAQPIITIQFLWTRTAAST